MSFAATFGLPDDTPTLASALSIEKSKEKHIIKNNKGVSAIIHQYDPTTKYSMTVEAVDTAIEPGDGSALAIPGLPESGYNSLDSVKSEYKNDGNGQTVLDGVVYPEGEALGV